MCKDKKSPTQPPPVIQKTEAEWQRIRPNHTFLVARKDQTEPAFSGAYWDHWESGIYRCACCHQVLFSSESKFDAYCGWPSFDRTYSQTAISEHDDFSHQMQRIEVRCAKCQAHLGHLFNDGPTQTRQRYCINSAAIEFIPQKNLT